MELGRPVVRVIVMPVSAVMMLLSHIEISVMSGRCLFID